MQWLHINWQRRNKIFFLFLAWHTYKDFISFNIYLVCIHYQNVVVEFLWLATQTNSIMLTQVRGLAYDGKRILQHSKHSLIPFSLNTLPYRPQKAERLVWPSKIANTKQALLLQSTLQTFLVIFRYTNQSIGIVGPLVQVGILRR